MMKLNLSIQYEVEDDSDDVRQFVENLIAEESLDFARSIRHALANAGITDIEMTTKEMAEAA